MQMPLLQIPVDGRQSETALAVARGTGRLVTIGLGSCVAIALPANAKPRSCAMPIIARKEYQEALDVTATQAFFLEMIATFFLTFVVFGAIIALCLLTFRSLRATLSIVLPLGLVSLLGYALMAEMGIGLKVSTLPVVAFGVGLGVDYGIYIYSRFQSFLDDGLTIYHSGDCAPYEGLARNLSGFQIDLALLPVNGRVQTTGTV